MLSKLSVSFWQVRANIQIFFTLNFHIRKIRYFVQLYQCVEFFIYLFIAYNGRNVAISTSFCIWYKSTNEKAGLSFQMDWNFKNYNWKELFRPWRQLVLLTIQLQFQRSCFVTEISYWHLVLNNHYREVSQNPEWLRLERISGDHVVQPSCQVCCTGSCPGDFWMSPKETPKPLWASMFSMGYFLF